MDVILSVPEEELLDLWSLAMTSDLGVLEVTFERLGELILDETAVR